jgi:cell division protein FtsQ
VARWARIGLWVVVLGLPLVAYLAAVNSETFRLRRVEVIGTQNVDARIIEDSVRAIAGDRLLDVDIEEVRKHIGAEKCVAAATVIRVLPDTLRVEIDEREPLVVVRLGNGRVAWVDKSAVLLDDYRPGVGEVPPPPLTGFDETEGSEAARADNRDRVARYVELREVLTPGGLWDRIDEVDMTYLKDVKVHLTDSPVQVRVGDQDFRARLETALALLNAVKTGDTGALARYHVVNVGQLIAASELIDCIDVTRPNGSITLSYRERPRPAVAAEPAAPAASRVQAAASSGPQTAATRTIATRKEN